MRASGVAATAIVLFCSAAGGAAHSECKVGRLAELPVTMVGMKPLVPVKIEGAEVRLAADSGAFYSVLSPGAAAQLHLRLAPAPFGYRMGGVGGESEVSLATVKTFTLSGVDIPRVQFIVGGGEVGAGAVGVMGQNVLGLADVEYDLASGAIRLMRPSGCEHMAFAYWVAPGAAYSMIPIEPSERTNPHTRGTAELNGRSIKVIFDTGASNSVLSLRAAARVGITPQSPTALYAGTSGGFGKKRVRTWVAPFASFKIGDEEIKNARLRIGDFGFEDVDMLLGADFFLSHRVYVANSQHKLYFTYNGGPVFDLRYQDAVTHAPWSPVPGPGPAPTSAATAPTTGQTSQGEQAAKTAGEPSPNAPKDAEAYSRRGSARAARRDEEGAIDDFGKAIELAPNEPRYFYQRAMARLSARRPVLAISDLDAALKLEPAFVDARLVRAELRLGGNEAADAVADLDAADKAAPHEADMRLALGRLYLRADRFDAAVTQLDAWIAVHPDDSRRGGALNSRCWARALAGSAVDKALGDCNAAVRLMPLAAEPLDSRGLVHLRRGELPAALVDYDASLKLRPNEAWSLYGRGVARLKSGRKAEGDADLAAAAAAAPRLAARAKMLGITP